MKKVISIFILLSLITAFCGTVFAYTAPETVRVGLVSVYKDVSSIPISDSEIYVGSGLNQDFEINRSGLAVVLADSYYVDSLERYSDYDEAEEASFEFESEGYDAAPIYYGRNDFGVYVCASNQDRAYSIASEIDGSVLTSHGSQMALKCGNDTVLVTAGAIQISSSAGSLTSLGGRKYRGVIEFGRYNGGLITPVNVVDLDEYLYSVVASEMSASWHEEALKAQAVSARTYAVYNVGKHSPNGYGLCDKTDCQVYGGYNSEKESVTAAVKDTSGEILCYEGKPIQAVFSASSGGYTCSSENAWVSALPYLRAVSDSYESSVTWTRSFTASEIESILSSKGVNIGSVKNMAVTKFADGGRCLELTIVGTNGTKSYTKEAARTFFSSSRGGSLPSTMYTINGSEVPTGITSPMYAIGAGSNRVVSTVKGAHVYTSSGRSVIGSSSVSVVGRNGKTASYSGESVPSLNKDYLNQSASTFVLSGKGNGHGVGLSQYGAKGMAENGFTYREILEHYYTGAEIN